LASNFEIIIHPSGFHQMTFPHLSRTTEHFQGYHQKIMSRAAGAHPFNSQVPSAGLYQAWAVWDNSPVPAPMELAVQRGR